MHNHNRLFQSKEHDDLQTDFADTTGAIEISKKTKLEQLQETQPCSSPLVFVRNGIFVRGRGCCYCLCCSCCLLVLCRSYLLRVKKATIFVIATLLIR